MNETLSGVTKYLSFMSQQATEKGVTLFQKIGLNASQRFVSLLVLFLSLLIFYIAIKIAQPLIKYFLIILSVIIIVGTFVPFW